MKPVKNAIYKLDGEKHRETWKKYGHIWKLTGIGDKNYVFFRATKKGVEAVFTPYKGTFKFVERIYTTND